MSHPLLMALFSDISAAAAVARGAHAMGVDRADVSVVARDHQDEKRIANEIDASPGSEIEDSPAASRLGELSGYILAAIAIGLPGTGAVVAAGPLAAELGEVRSEERRVGKEWRSGEQSDHQERQDGKGHAAYARGGFEYSKYF